MEKKVAVLIDGDNISSKYASSIKEETSRIGRVSIFRVYGSLSSPVAKAWNKIAGNFGIMAIPQVSYIGNKSGNCLLYYGKKRKQP